jgi:hypothetical protein
LSDDQLVILEVREVCNVFYVLKSEDNTEYAVIVVGDATITNFFVTFEVRLSTTGRLRHRVYGASHRNTAVECSVLHCRQSYRYLSRI